MNTRRENAELQRQWDLEEEIRVNRKYRIALIIGIVAVYGLVGFVAWLAWGLSEVVGIR